MPKTKSPSLVNLVQFSHALADTAAGVTLRHFRKSGPVINKAAASGGFDPVTTADKGAEREIVRLIRATYPAHGIFGEESGAHGSGTDLRWVIDPIDGTRAFITGIPLWGTLIALVDSKAALLGVMDQPFTGERFWSGPKAAFTSLRGGRPRRLATRACPDPGDAILMTTSPDLFVDPFEARAFQRARSAVRMTRYGGDCYAYCMLASGHVDAVIESGLKIYDIAPLIPIVERAGGRVTSWDGGSALNGGRVLATGDARLHDRLLKLLSSS